MTAEVIAKRNGYEGDIIIPETVVSNRASFLVTSIGENAFFSCKSLTEITIPGSVKSLGHDVFSNCISLKTITYNGTQEKWKKIKKDTLADKWISGIPAKFVQCTDGLVKIQLVISDYASDHASDKVSRLLVSLDGDLDRSLLQELLGIKNRDYFRIEYLKPAIEDGFVELTIPDKPNSQHQKYRLTAKGLQLKELLEKNK